MSETGADVVLRLLTAHVDETIGHVLETFQHFRIPIKILLHDYIAQAVILEFPGAKPLSEKKLAVALRDDLENLGLYLRKKWPDLPPVAATLFQTSAVSKDTRRSEMKTRLLLDFSMKGRYKVLCYDAQEVVL